jgi:hypothetical protein
VLGSDGEARNGSGSGDFFISPTCGDKYNRSLIVIERPEEEWEEGERGFLMVLFDALPRGSEKQDPYWYRCTWSDLCDENESYPWDRFRDSIHWFNNYVGTEDFGEELRQLAVEQQSAARPNESRAV